MTIKLFKDRMSNPILHLKLKDLFTSKESILFLNDRLDEIKQAQIEQKLVNYFNESPLNILNSESFFLIPTSGSTSFNLKLVLLKKTAVINSARRVGNFFSFSQNENWLLTIPHFHIGGLSVLARAFAFDQKVYFQFKWKPAEFCIELLEKNIHYTSLVPTQIFDIISLKLKAPANLKVVFVGGGILSEQHFTIATELGWPIVKTFGMTETSSMIAYSRNKELSYDFFPNCFGRISKSGHLEVKSDSLFSGYLIENSGNDSFHFQSFNLTTENDYWQTEDLADIENSHLYIKGRQQDILKIKGELVNLNDLRKAFSKIFESHFNPSGFAIISQSHERNENELILIIDKNNLPLHQRENLIFENILSEFNKTMLPFERIFTFVVVDSIERTELGKIKYASFKTHDFQEYLNENRKTIME